MTRCAREHTHRREVEGSEGMVCSEIARKEIRLGHAWVLIATEPQGDALRPKSGTNPGEEVR